MAFANFDFWFIVSWFHWMVSSNYDFWLSNQLFVIDQIPYIGRIRGFARHQYRWIYMAKIAPTLDTPIERFALQFAFPRQWAVFNAWVPLFSSTSRHLTPNFGSSRSCLWNSLPSCCKCIPWPVDRKRTPNLAKSWECCGPTRQWSQIHWCLTIHWRPVLHHHRSSN